MVKFTASVVTLAMAAAVTAAPAASSETIFSFASWVEDIIANPDTALSPEQAVAALPALSPPPSGDAAACLNDLARKGSAGTNCVVAQSAIQMCRIGGAELVGTKAEAGTYTVNCNDIARTGGLIFDTCYRADNTVKGSEFCITNSNIQVNIQGV
uniref:Uncharacterized protein n=1 Tax=Colletotrichum fructicola (strain Nara gc5) TaxID=1213859 RepID=L2FKS5_COLFN